MDLFRRFRFVVLFAVAFPATAFATPPGWYVAIEGGQARYPGITGNAGQWMAVTPSPPEGMVIVDSQSSLQHGGSNDTGYKLIAGYQFNPYFGVEGGYVALGSVQSNGTGTVDVAPADGFLPLEEFATFTDTARLRVHGWELAATGTWPLNQHWSLFGRLGAFRSHTTLDITSNPAPPLPGDMLTEAIHESSTDWTPTYGVGANYSPIPHWTFRLSLNRYAHLGDSSSTGGRFDVNLVSLGVVYAL
jgi:OOP family OmpA-OmpF porin